MWRTRSAITAIVGMALWAGATGATGMAHAAAPAPYSVTPELIAAAREEGTVVFYTATDVQVAEELASKFEETYPGISVQVERSGSERVFQRLGDFADNVLSGPRAARFDEGNVPLGHVRSNRQLQLAHATLSPPLLHLTAKRRRRPASRGAHRFPPPMSCCSHLAAPSC